MLHEIWLEPAFEEARDKIGGVGSYGQQIQCRFVCVVCFSKLAVCGCDDDRSSPEVGHVDLAGEFKSELIVGFAIGIDRKDEPIPAGMMRIEIARPCGQSGAA